MFKKLLSLSLLLVMMVALVSPFVEASGTQFTTNSAAWDHYYQRHSWFSQGRFWVYYSDGSNAVYQSSLDGVTWTAKSTIITGVTTTQRCDAALSSDGVTVHFVGAKLVGVLLCYVMGVCQPDGTVTLSGFGVSSFGSVSTECSIVLDSQDYPTMLYNGNTEATLKSIRNTLKNGNWVTGGEGTQTICTDTDVEGKAVSIGAQNLYVVYVKTITNSLLYGKRYDFATKSWGVEETVSSTHINGYSFSVVSDGSVVYLSWYEIVSGHGYSAVRSSLGVWVELGDVTSEAIVATPSVVRDSEFGGAWVLWADATANVKIRHVSPLGVLSSAKFVKESGVPIVETGILGLEAVEIVGDVNHLGICYRTATGHSFDIINIYSDFYITNMEGSDAYGAGLKLIVVEEEFYNFQLDVTGVSEDPVEYASVRFYNNGNLIQVDYNATTGLTKIVDGGDYILLHEVAPTTSGDTLSVKWEIWLKNNLIDKEDLDIEVYYSLDSGAFVGWVTYPSYCDLYNKGGYVSSTMSGASTTTTSTATIITTSITVASTKFYTTTSVTPVSTVVTTTVSTTSSCSSLTSTSKTATTVTTSTTTTVPGVSTQTITFDTSTNLGTSSVTTCTTSKTSTTFGTTTLTCVSTSSTVYTTTSTSSTVVTTTKATYTLMPGLAGVSPGGGLFDLYVNRNSMVKAQVAYRNLQYVHAIFNYHVDRQVGWDDYEVDVVPLEIGIDYWTGTSYVSGWSVRIELSPEVFGNYGTGGYIDESQLRLSWTITWLFNGVQVGDSVSMNTYPVVSHIDTEDYISLEYPASTSFIIDMWYDKTNSSSVVAGRVTAEYYAMSNSAPVWTRLLTGGTWGPLVSQSTQVMFYHPLLDSLGVKESANNVEMSYFWVKLSQDNNVNNVKYSLKDWDVLDLVISGEAGVNTPVFVKTKVPFIEAIGILGSMKSGLDDFVNRYYGQIGTAFSGVSSTVDNTVDSVFAVFGMSGMYTTFKGMIFTWWGLIRDSLADVFDIITSILNFTVKIFMFSKDFFISIIDTVISIFDIVVGIFEGTTAVGTGISEIWAMLNIAVALPLISIYLLLDWVSSVDKRAKGSFGKWVKLAYADVSIFIGVVMGVLMFIFEVAFGWILRIIGFLRGLVPVV